MCIRDRYEAARTDGASRMQCIWHITLPGIMSVITMMLTIRVGTVLDSSFEQVYVMSNVEVRSVGEIIDTWVYRTGLQPVSYTHLDVYKRQVPDSYGM